MTMVPLAAAIVGMGMLVAAEKPLPKCDLSDLACIEQQRRVSTEQHRTFFDLRRSQTEALAPDRLRKAPNGKDGKSKQ